MSIHPLSFGNNSGRPTLNNQLQCVFDFCITNLDTYSKHVMVSISSYCMRVLPRYVPQIWFCETCGSGDIVTQISIRKEPFHRALESNTSEIVHFDMSRSVGSRRLNEESGSSGYHKKKVSWRTGRVKFIPFEEAVKMSSGVQNVKLPSPSELHSSSVVQKDISETRSRRDATDLKSAPPKYSRQKVKETYRSARDIKHSGHGSEEISSITLAQESKSCTEVKCRSWMLTVIEQSSS